MRLTINFSEEANAMRSDLCERGEADEREVTEEAVFSK